MTDTTQAPDPAPIPTMAEVYEFLVEAWNYRHEQDKASALRWAKRHGVQPQDKPRTLSQWAMGLLLECPHKYLLAQLLKIRTKAGKPSLMFGTAIDAGVNERLGINGNLKRAHTAFQDSWDEQVEAVGGLLTLPQDWTVGDYRLAGAALLDAAEPTLDKIRPVHTQHWLDWAPIVDPRTNKPRDGFMLSGKLDVLDMVQHEGMDEPWACITDTKALTTLTKPEDHYLVTRLSLQLVGYAYASQQDQLLRELPGIGRLVGYLEGQRKKPPAPPKLKKDGTPSKAKPAAPPKVQRTFADVGPQEFQELLLFASHLVDQVERGLRLEAEGHPLDVAWPRNMAACNRDAYGQPCDFRPLCRAKLYGSHPGLRELFTYEPQPKG
jgi:hypothetical protein